MVYQKVPTGTVLCREGEPADAFFVVVTGKCKVAQRDKDGDGEFRMGTVHSLEFFGEGFERARSNSESFI